MAAPCGVRLKDVTYQYADGDKPVLDSLSFDFIPGTCTAVLGETGSGKTTLIRLLVALLHPQKGSVTIYDRQGNEDIVTACHRCNFVYVPQGNTLMSGSIRDNLLLASPDATEQDMLDVLKKSCAEFVEDLPEGLDTLCSEKGGGLSEGQSQRISIARALLRNRPVMLFDEATSALDPETERRLLDNILATNDKTIIFITHRMTVVEYCNQALTL